jgi:fatty acid desaturase
MQDMGSKGSFVSRAEIEAVQWDNQRKDWVRPHVDREVLKELTQRSTLNGVVRVLYFIGLLTGASVLTVVLSRIHIALAIPGLYLYWFFYGFWVAIAHELQHQTVFAKRENWLSEALFYVVQTLIWNSPTYARVSHKLHHRYTMVRGFDPETEWPEIITHEWLRKHFAAIVLRILLVGAVWDLGRDIWTQLKRAAGVKNWMIKDHCTDKQARAIRIESAQILVVHLALAAFAIVTQTWWVLLFVTIAWQIGAPIERLWHDTKHIARPYNVKDHRLNTRSVRVGWFIRTFFWGLDDHVDHHLYPAVPSRNLPKLHKILEPELPDPDNVFGCWAEMFEISKKKSEDPTTEYVSAEKALPEGG